MPDAPLVSVIMPCYNGARFIAESIESVLAQTHENLELIVVDDGSTDDSMEIVRGFGGRVRSEALPQNQGVNFARNRGVELACGDFVQFLDSDDLLRPEKVSRSLAAFDDSVDVVFTGVESFGAAAPSQALPDAPGWYRLVRRMLGSALLPPDFDPEFPLEFFVRQGAQTAQLLHRIFDLGQHTPPKLEPKSSPKVIEKVIVSNICETLFFDDPTVSSSA